MQVILGRCSVNLFSGTEEGFHKKGQGWSVLPPWMTHSPASSCKKQSYRMYYPIQNRASKQIFWHRSHALQQSMATQPSKDNSSTEGECGSGPSDVVSSWLSVMLEPICGATYQGCTDGAAAYHVCSSIASTEPRPGT